MLWLIIAGLVFLLGVALLAIGLRGRRIDDHPFCRRCRYDLSGLGEKPETCPECGRDLTKRRAVRRGCRRKRPLFIVPGAALLLMGLIGAGIVAWPAARDFDWNTVKPVWWLKREALGGATATADAARKELIRRLSWDKLSPAQALDLANTALELQADLDRAWQGQWGSIIELAWYQGHVDDAALEQYFRNATAGGVEFVSPERARKTGTLAFLVKTDLPRAGGRKSILQARLWFDEVRLDDEVVPIKESGYGDWSFITDRPRSNRPYWSTDVRRMQGTILVDADPGEYELTVRWTMVLCLEEFPLPASDATVPLPVDLNRAGGGGGRYSYGKHKPQSAPDALFQRQFSFTRPLRIVPEDDRVFELVDDDALIQAVRQSIAIDEAFVTIGEDGPGSVHFRMMVTQPPADLAFDLTLGCDPAGKPFWPEFKCLKGKTAKPHPFLRARDIANFDPEAKTVDLILTPNPRLLEDTAGVTGVWNRPIVIENVPLEERE